MNEPRTQPLTPMPADTTSGLGMILTMGGIGLACAVLIVLTYTLPAIERNKAAFLEKAIFDVLPGTTEKITFAPIDNVLRPLEGDEEADMKFYAGYDTQKSLTGIAVEAEGQGFQDLLRILYGYSPQCRCIVGMKVLESKETPGLGDKIETDPKFRANFEALEVDVDANMNNIIHPITLVKPREKHNPWEIEGISGATISSRAVTDILRASTAVAVPLIEQNLSALQQGNTP